MDMRSEYILCREVPLYPGSANTLTFSSEGEQLAYFRTKAVYSAANSAPVRLNAQFTVPYPVDSVRGLNYMCFKNITRWECAFILDAVYINDNSSAIIFQIDYWQTYLFKYAFKPCFIERETVADDSLFSNLTPESVNVGDYVVAQKYDISYSQADIGICVLCTYDVSKILIDQVFETPEYSSISTGSAFLPNGLYLAFFPGMTGSYTILFNALITLCEQFGKPECIIGAWLYPSNLLALQATAGAGEACYKVVGVATDSIRFDTNYSGLKIDGYTPKNKKLLQYPYNIIYATNNSGNGAIFKPEKAIKGAGTATEYFDISLIGDCSVNATVSLGIENYMGMGNIPDVAINYDDTVISQKLPQVSYGNDAYAIWYAQNKNTIENSFNSLKISNAMNGFNFATGAMTAVLPGAVGGAAAAGTTATGAGMTTAGVGQATGAIAGAVNIIQQVNSLVAQIEDAAVRGVYASGQSTACIAWQHGARLFDLYRKCIDSEHAEIVDNYFSMFGYAINVCRQPNITSRPNWNYLKTAGESITGDIPAGARASMNNDLNAGMTFWHSASTIYDYTRSNSV